MSKLNKNNYSSSSVYNVVYSAGGGVDFSGDGSSVSRGRYAYLENMYRDYDGDGAGIIESIPGYRKVINLDGKCNGLYSYKNASGKECLVAHIDNGLFEFKVDTINSTPSARRIYGLASKESRAFSFGDALYVLDGTSIFKISEDFMGSITEAGGGIYVPTTHINGTQVEQRNLLTRNFCEKFVIGSCDTVSYGSEGVRYVITDTERLWCKVVGFDNYGETSLYIPARTKIGDTYYSVREIGAHAFEGDTVITECIIASGTVSIGTMAFYKCTSLKTVILPDSVATLGDSVFADCTSLSKLHLGIGIDDVGKSTIINCSSLGSIHYAGTGDDFSKVTNIESFGSKHINYNATENSSTISIPISNPCVVVSKVTLDDINVSYEVIKKNTLCTMVKITLNEKSDAEGKTLKIFGMLSSSDENYENMGLGGFIPSVYKYESGSTESVILGCRVCATFDGRVFLAGNPSYPGYVFHTSLDGGGEGNPLYFGEMNYFRDGSGNFDITSMLKTGDSLAVFKEGDDGSGSIFYHAAESTGDPLVPKIYPTVYTHCGFAAKGGSISFFDDPVFISEKGVSAFEKKSVNLERSIVTRSNNINPRFLCEDISKARLTVWRGYLVVSVGENMYLADSRSTFIGREGNTEYEWYFLRGIGTYTSDKAVYRYSSSAHAGYNVHPDSDAKVKGTVHSVVINGETVYYVSCQYGNCEVYQTEERTGGIFTPASHVIAVGELLFFATSSGQICVFNNDKRGIAPPSVLSLPEYNPQDYSAEYGRRIHPYYYSFAGHAPRYALITPKDNCGIPHLLKSTKKRSLTLKCRAVSSGLIKCEVGSDREGYSEVCSFPNKDLSFSDIDFSSMSLDTDDVYTVALSEKLKNWVEKQITVYTDEYGSPFGIYSIAYRFTVKGNIKNHK